MTTGAKAMVHRHDPPVMAFAGDSMASAAGVRPAPREPSGVMPLSPSRDA